MATPTPRGYEQRHYPKAGSEKAFSNMTAGLFISPSEGEFGYFPANLMAEQIAYDVLLKYGNGAGYTATDHIETKDNSGTIAYTDATAGGLLWTIPNNANNDLATAGILESTPASNKIFVASFTFILNDATNTALLGGVVTDGQTDLSADPTDGVWISSAAAATTCLLNCRGNSGTKASSSSLGTLVDATEHRVTFSGWFNATTGASHVRMYFDGTDKSSLLTAAMQAQMAAVLTTPPDLIGFFGLRGQDESAVVRSVYVAMSRFTVDGRGN